MVSHYLFEPEFCNPASGWEKGQVEKYVQDTQRRLWQPMPRFLDNDALNAWLEEQCVVQWGQIPHGVLSGALADLHAAEGKVLCEHGRVIARSHHLPGRTIYDWRHYLAVVQRKPGAVRNGAPFTEMPDAFRQLQGQFLRRPGGDREMVEILSRVLDHDEQAVPCAVELELEAGLRR